MKLSFLCQTKSGSKYPVVRVWAGGTSTTPNFLAAHFVKQNTKFGGGESEGGAEIHFPHTPFLPAAPEQKIEASPVALLVESKAQQKSFLFLLEEKDWVCVNPEMQRKLFCWLASVSSRWRGGFRSYGRFPVQKRFAHFQTKGTIFLN